MGQRVPQRAGAVADGAIGDALPRVLFLARDAELVRVVGGVGSADGIGPLAPGTIPISQMTPNQIRGAYVLYIGAGAVAAGGIISLFRSLPTIWHGLKGGLKDFGISRGAATDGVEGSSEAVSGLKPALWPPQGVPTTPLNSTTHSDWQAAQRAQGNFPWREVGARRISESTKAD